MSEPFLGEIRIVGFTFAPVGWAFCNGQLLPISQNTALFSLLGTTYGGDGVSTFALPNLQSRVPIHFGQGAGLSPYVQGQVGGSETVTLNANQLPSHAHPVNCNVTVNPTSNKTTPGGNFPAAVHQSQFGIYEPTANGTMASGMIGATGSNSPVPNVQPYLCLNFIIALQGIFPSRN